jgi:hypothetical protein
LEQGRSVIVSKDTNCLFAASRIGRVTRNSRVERDRHGRGLRGSLIRSVHRGPKRPTTLVSIVAGAVEYLKSEFPNELGSLKWRVSDNPPVQVIDGVERVRRWTNDSATMTIHIYRLPIERLGHVRRTDAAHERMHIEEYVFSAAADLIGKEPWELLPGGER